MLNQYKTKREEGFTIIEVLIVLAIAGLIILIVFLAVPALQRNSRNTQRRNDVSSLLGAVQEYSNNNAGSLPTDGNNFTGNVKLGFYAVDNISYLPGARPTTALTDTSGFTNNDTVYVRDFAKCENNGLVTTASQVSRRNVVAIYFVETAGGAAQMQCMDM